MLAAVGDEIKSPDNIVSGKWYYIKGVYTSNKTDVACYYNAPDAAGKYTGTPAASIDDATPFKFTKVEGGWTITSVKGYYLRPHTSNGQTYLVEDEVVLGIASGTTKEGENKGIKIGPYSDYYIQSNTSSAKIGAYKATQYDVTLIEAPEQTAKTETSLSFGETTEYTVNIGESFTAPTLSITPTAIATSVTYSSSNTEVATVNSTTGEVNLTGAAGSTTISATYEGSDSYYKSSASYTLNVVDPTLKKVTFEFGANKYDWEYTSDNNTYFNGSDYIAKEGEISAGFSGKVRLWLNKDAYTMRFYSDDTYGRGQMTLTADEGYVITQVVVSGSTLSFQLPEGAGGSLTGGTWTGEANSLVLQKGSSTSNFTTVDVYYKEKTAPEPKTYSLVGWINGADYGCDENPGEYIFDEDGKLTVNFKEDSYVFVKTTDNNSWYLTESYVPYGEAGAQVTATMVNGKNYGEKMQVPGGYDIELTLTEKDDDTIELTYTMPEYGPKTYSLVGWINGANYGCEDDWENPGEYTFDPEGKLNMYFDEDSYVFVKTTDNKKWYLAEEYVPKGNPNTTVTAPMANGSGYSEKMEIPSGYDIEMTLRETGNNTIELSVNIIQPSEKVISNNEIEDYTSMGGPLMWQGRDDIGNYVTVAFDAEGNLDKKYTSIMTADFEEKYGATSGTASITTGEDGSKTLDATIRFGEYGIFHITGTIAAPAPCPFGLPTVTATTEDITFVFDLTDAVKGKDTPELEATIVVKKGEMEYTGGISEEDVVDGKVIKTISNSIFSADFSSLALEAGDEIVVTFPKATLWETVEGKWNKAWTGEVEGSVNVTVKAVLPTPNVKVSTTHFNLDLDLSTITEGLDDPALSTTIEVKHGAKTYIYDQIDFYDVSSGKLSLDVDNVKLIGDDEFLPEEDDKIVVTLKNACISYVDGELKSIIFADSEGVKVTVIGTDMEQIEVVENEIIKTGENSYWHAWKPERETEFYIAFDDEGNIMVNDISMRLYGKEVLGHSATGYVITNEDGSMEIEATIRFYDMPSLYRINATIAAPAPCPFGLPTITATTEEVVITFDLADAVEGVENPTLESINILINDKYHSGFSETDVVDGKVEVKIPFANFSDMEGKAPEFTEGQEITVTIPEVALYENYTAGGYKTLYEGAMEGAVTVTVTTASGINILSSASDNVVKYNLAGQRVRNAKGIIIVNGKKVAVK